jgi:hypothetical protein
LKLNVINETAERRLLLHVQVAISLINNLRDLRFEGKRRYVGARMIVKRAHTHTHTVTPCMPISAVFIAPHAAAASPVNPNGCI